MRILIIRLSSLGDIALLSPVFEEIKRAYPAARLSCLVKPAFAGLLAGSPGLDELLLYEGFWKTLKALRRQHWDAVLDLHAVLRTRLLYLFIPGRWKATYKKNFWERYALVWPVIQTVIERARAIASFLVGEAAQSAGERSISKDLYHPHLALSPQGRGRKTQNVLRSESKLKWPWRSSSNGTHALDRYRKALFAIGIGIRRVVVLQTALMGDVVLTLPLLREIRERLKPERLAVVARPEYASLFSREGFSVVEDDKLGTDRGFSGFLRMRRRLAREGFDLAVAPQRSLRSALLAFFAGIPLRAGFSNSAGWILWNRRAEFLWPEHDTERNLKLLEAIPLAAIGVETRPSGFGIPERPGEGLRARRIWEASGVDDGREFIIGLAPGASRQTKRWLSDGFIHVGRELARRKPGSRVAVFGGPLDEPLCREVAGKIGGGAVNLAGRVGIEDLAALIRSLKLFVTNDSGPMHLAWGSGVPTVAVFGPTVKGFGFYPMGERTRVVEEEGLACRPCGLHGGSQCPRGHFLCMRLITPEMVIRACEEVLGGVLSAER